MTDPHQIETPEAPAAVGPRPVDAPGAVRLACRRAARAGAEVALGLDLGAYLTSCPRTRAAAAEQGLVAWGCRLTLAGLRLVQAEQVDAAAKEQERRAALQAELERVRAEARRAEEERQAVLAQVAQLGALQRLAEELRALRGALEGLDASPRAAGACRLGAARVATSARCAGAAARSAVCWSRQPSCLVPRARPFLVALPGGSRRQESPAAKRSRLAWERARALAALERAARRWLQVETLCGQHRYRRVPVVGADLAPYLASSRKERRRQRPLYALGYLETAAVAAPGAPQRLTEAGRAYLLQRLVEEQRARYGLTAERAAA